MRKRFKVKGMISIPSKMYFQDNVPFTVHITKDKKGFTFSIGSEEADVQFSIPFAEIYDKLSKAIKEDHEEDSDEEAADEC